MNIVHRNQTALTWFLHIILLAVILTPIIKIPFGAWSPAFGQSFYSRIVIETALATWIILAVHIPEYRPKFSWVILALGAWLTVSIIASFTGVNTEHSLWSHYYRMNGVIDLAHWFIYALMMVTAFRTRQSWQIILGITFAVGVIATSTAFSQSILTPETRPQGTLSNGLEFGHFALISTGLGICVMGLCPPSWIYWKLRWCIGGATGITAWAVWLSATRSSMLAGAVLVAVCYTGLMVVGTRKTRILATTSLLAIALALIALSVITIQTDRERPGMMERWAKVGQSDNSTNNRLSYLQAGIAGFKEKPLLGWGPGNFQRAWGRHSTQASPFSENKNVGDAHNIPVETLVTTGIAGFTIYLFLCGTVLWVAWIQVKKNVGWLRFPHIALLGTLVAYYVQGVFGIHFSSVFLLFTVIASYLAWAEVQPDSGPPSVPGKTPGKIPLAATATLILAAIGTWVAVVLLTIVPQVRAASVLPREFFVTNIEEFIETVTIIETHHDLFPPMGADALVDLVKFTGHYWVDADSETRERIIEDVLPRTELAIERVSRKDPHNLLLDYHAAHLYGLLSEWDAVYYDKASYHRDRLKRGDANGGERQ